MTLTPREINDGINAERIAKSVGYIVERNGKKMRLVTNSLNGTTAHTNWVMPRTLVRYIKGAM